MKMEVRHNLLRPSVKAANYRLSERATARFTDFDAEDNLPGVESVEVDVVVQDGHPVCDEIRVKRRDDGPSLTGAELRRIPLAKIVPWAAAMTAMRSELLPGGLTKTWPISPEEVPEALETFSRPRRRNAVTDQRLQDVARFVRDNAEAGAPPWQIVRDLGNVGRSQAFRLLELAVEKGYLEPEETKVKR